MAQDFTFDITEAAANHIKSLTRKQKKDFFRIIVESGGCSGFQYIFRLDDKAAADDTILHQKDVQVVVDAISAGFLENAQLDHVKTMVGSHFSIKNPNTHTACGCGNSFSI